MADQEKEQSQSNIKLNANYAASGLNMDNTLNQLKPGSLTYALNAALENFDSNSVNYQNEQGNELCLTFPKSYVLIGEHFINEKNIIAAFRIGGRHCFRTEKNSPEDKSHRFSGNAAPIQKGRAAHFPS